MRRSPIVHVAAPLLLALAASPAVLPFGAAAQAPVPFQFPNLGAANITNADGTLYFSGRRSDLADIGFEPWLSDGTTAGTRLVKDIHDQNPTYGFSSDSDNFVSLGDGLVLFTAVTGDAPTSVPTYGEGEELWRSDGTTAGTVLVKDIWPGPNSAFHDTPDPIAILNGVAFFAANDGADGFELWRSDGTAAGTVMVKDIQPGTSGSFPTFFAEYNGLLYFRADDGTGAELWRTDGTTAGTQMVDNINPSGASNPASLTVAGGWLYFSATDGVSGAELWKTDGTAPGTSLVADLREGNAVATPPRDLTDLDGLLVFRGSYTFQGVTCGPELFVSDGTEGGTVLIDVRPGCGASNISEITRMGEAVYFAASDGTVDGGGLELWKSDGTAEGTALVADINPGVTASAPSLLTPGNGILYFRATHVDTGVELWRSDGTSAGTHIVADLAPGPDGSHPLEIAASGNTLFFIFGQNTPFPIGSLFGLDLGGGGDGLPPIITPVGDGTLGANGWYVSDVSVSWTINDQGFPVNSSTGCGPQTVSTDTAGLTITCSATNAGGTTSQSVTIRRDTTPPEAIPTPSPAPAAGGWYRTDVTVTWNGVDATSGIDTCTSPVTVTTEGQNQSSGPGTCTDNAGLVSAPMQLTNIHIDKTPPQTTVTPSSENNEFGWYNVDVTAAWTGVDALSGVASCTPPQTISTEGAGQVTVNGTCTDVAGNESGGIHIFNINIDKTPPSAVVVHPRGVIDRHQIVLVEYTCDDDRSGVLSCAGPQPNGTLLDTSKPTKKGMFTVTVTDLAGNQTTITVPYEIAPVKGGGRGGGPGGGLE